jgi:hypothetical protein
LPYFRELALVRSLHRDPAPMRLGAFAVLPALMTACVYVPYPSNIPGSGVTCPATPTQLSDPGAMSGPLAFAVASSCEQFAHDANSDAGPGQLTVLLMGPVPALISDGGASDGGQTRAFSTSLSLWLSTDDSRQPFSPGDYPLGAGAGASWSSDPSDGGYQTASAHSGNVVLNAVLACSASGTFDLWFALDGGALTELAGTFDAPYCQQL